MSSCCICLRTGVDPALTLLLDCGHGFCLACIREWATKQCTCPICQSAFDLDRAAPRSRLEPAIAREIVQMIDELTRNPFMHRSGKPILVRGRPLTYSVSGKVGILYESHKSKYLVTFAWDGSTHTATVDCSRSVAYFMNMDVVVDGGDSSFTIEYVDH